MDANLAEFEIACVANLMPENAEEARFLVPSLDVRALFCRTCRTLSHQLPCVEHSVWVAAGRAVCRQRRGAADRAVQRRALQGILVDWQASAASERALTLHRSCEFIADGLILSWP